MSFRLARLLLLALPLAGTVEAAAVNVRFDEGKLSVASRAVPARDVFSAIAEKTGIRFVIDKELKPGTLTIDITEMQLERAIRNVVGAIPQVAGHTMTYAREPSGAPRLEQVSIYGPGRALAGSTVYEAPSGSPIAPIPTPDLQERMERMIEAGVPRETAEKVLELTAEVQRLQGTPEPGSYRPEDLTDASREQLQPLIDRGVPMERAVQMLLLQEKYQQTLKELSAIPGGLDVPGMPGSAGSAPSFGATVESGESE